MDWYYPMLTGALTGEVAKARLNESWSTFAMEGKGVRCVSDRALDHRLRNGRVCDRVRRHWRSRHRHRSVGVDPGPPLEDGSYWTGLVWNPAGGHHGTRFPDEEHTSYTAAAVILAADAITGASPASGLFTTFPH